MSVSYDVDMDFAILVYGKHSGAANTCRDTELAQLRRQVQDLTQRTRQLENEKRCSEELVAQLDDEKRCSEELVVQLIEQYGALNQEYHELLFNDSDEEDSEESSLRHAPTDLDLRDDSSRESQDRYRRFLEGNPDAASASESESFGSSSVASDGLPVEESAISRMVRNDPTLYRPDPGPYYSNGPWQPYRRPIQGRHQHDVYSSGNFFNPRPLQS
ncbi:hypothetical protein NLI96_g4475 [Meripilus lineatus]|uniref:Uncharacterized protein n=1 Tax=Meripilus lineatus TaxID=2056292 RepID=A0AAD5V730_9APHY|nr:hypothetical protein NLI96_g4475 [Physisporinus lineatus]